MSRVNLHRSGRLRSDPISRRPVREEISDHIEGVTGFSNRDWRDSADNCCPGSSLVRALWESGNEEATVGRKLR